MFTSRCLVFGQNQFGALFCCVFLTTETLLKTLTVKLSSSLMQIPLFLHGLDAHSSGLNSQNLPSYPLGHLHSNEPDLSTQLPPFIQGLLPEQPLTVLSQSKPVDPTGHRHLNPLSLIEKGIKNQCKRHALSFLYRGFYVKSLLQLKLSTKLSRNFLTLSTQVDPW